MPSKKPSPPKPRLVDPSPSPLGSDYRWPEKIGDLADYAYKIQQKRLTAERKIDSMKAEEKALEDFLINKFPKEKLVGVKGRNGSISLKQKDVPQVDDWNKLYAHIKKTGEFELLHKRCTEEAFTERWEAGKEVPGVVKFNKIKLHIGKAK